MMNNPTLWVCETCGGSNVWQPAWVDPNLPEPQEVLRVGDRIEGVEDWCDDCEGETKIEEKESE